MLSIFPNLFSIALKPNITVAEVFEKGIDQLKLVRQLVGVYLDEWIQLQVKFKYLKLSNDSADAIKWKWTSNGIL